MNRELGRKISIETISAIFVIVFVALFILVNIFYGFSWPLYILAMLLSFAISIRYPRSGLFAIVFLTMIFERFFTLQTFFIGKVEYKIYPLDILMLGIIIGLAFQFLFNKIKIKLKKSDWVLIAFIILNATYFFTSAYVTGGDRALAFSSLKNYGFYSLLYFVTIFSIRGTDDFKRLGKFFLAGAVGIILFIIIGVLRGEGLWSEFTPLSTSGMRLLAFTHGLYLALAIIPAILFRLFDKNPSKNFSTNFLIVIWAFGILATLMRHLWIALAMVLVLIYPLIPKEKKADLQKIAIKYLAVLAVGFVAVFYVSALDPQSRLSVEIGSVVGVVAERTGSLGNIGQDESYFWRTLVWKSAYVDFKSNPVFGIGTGKKVYVENGKEYKDFVEVRNIHNSYLAILIQFGFLGLFLFLYFVYKNWTGLLKAYWSDKENWQSLAILGIISIYLIAIFFQPYLETNLLSIFFWIALGLARNTIYENSRNK